jgi:hypothetical protein
MTTWPGFSPPGRLAMTWARTAAASGYTATVRPPTEYTRALKRSEIGEAGYGGRSLASYEEDHLVPLELGGAPSDERNLWPEPIGEARVEDREEDALHAGVGTRRLSLAEAQQRILADWGPKG